MRAKIVAFLLTDILELLIFSTPLPTLVFFHIIVISLDLKLPNFSLFRVDTSLLCHSVSMRALSINIAL